MNAASDVHNHGILTGHTLTTVMILIFWTDWVWANSVDPDQTAPLVDHCLHCLLAASFGHYCMVEPHCSNFRIITVIVWVSKYLGILQYLGSLCCCSE